MKTRILATLTMTVLLSALGSQAVIADNWCGSALPGGLVRLRASTSSTITNGAGWVLIASRSANNGGQLVDEVWDISASLNGTASGSGTYEIGVGLNGTVVSYWTARVSGSGYVSIALNTSEYLTPATRTVGLYARATGADLLIRPAATNGLENAALLITRHQIIAPGISAPGGSVVDCQ